MSTSKVLLVAVYIRRYIHTHTLFNPIRLILWRLSEFLGTKTYGEDFTADDNLDSFINL